MGDERRWTAALEEHETVVRAFLTECEAVAPADWQRAPHPGKWNPAVVVLHICNAYELGRDAIAGGPGMRLLVPPGAVWFARNLLLPFLLATKRFPKGANAPAEVVPDVAEARLLSKEAAAARLLRVSNQAATALRHAADNNPSARVMHAFFGALDPYAALRVLSAHTLHHTRLLSADALRRRRALTA